MTKKIEFFFDVGSPYTYLAYTQLPGLAEKTGAEILWRPMLLGGVFKAVNNVSPAEIPPKGSHMNIDLARHAARYGVPFQLNPHFPIFTIALMRGAIVAQEGDFLKTYLDAVFQAIWIDAENMNEPEVVGRVLSEAGLDATAIFARVQEQDIKDKLKANTEEAVARGVYGAPTFFVGADMYFGQDRLDFVAEALGP
jgi:2-hydroxychromene-2-carboxylate isomerase